MVMRLSQFAMAAADAIGPDAKPPTSMAESGLIASGRRLWSIVGQPRTQHAQLNAYLSFDGNCAEAMKFYAEVLGAKVEALMTYAEVPGATNLPASDGRRIMHAYLVHPEFSLMAGDTPPGTAYEA